MRKSLILSVILVLTVVGLWLARPVYRRWSQERSLAQAREFLAKADYRNASLSARKALGINPTDIHATRIMAQIAELAGSPEAVKWRQRIVDLEPDILKNRLDLVRVALAHGDLQRAKQTLQAVAPAGKQTSEYHQVAAMTAAAAGQMELAEQHFAEAARMEPENKLVQLDLAVLRLQSPDPQVAQAAERQLEQLSTDGALRREVLRQLTLNSLRQENLARARLYSNQLQAETGIRFEDRVLHLTVLDRGDAEETKRYLAELRQAAERRPEDVAALAGWMLAHDRSSEALRWLTNLPPALQQQPPVGVALAECCVAQEDWVGLQGLLAGQQWAELEFLRLAMLARAAGRQGQTLVARTRWGNATREARDNLNALRSLLRLTKAWGWETERDDLLWVVLQRFPREKWVLRELEQCYLARGETRGLNQVYATLVEYDFKDVTAKNNLATTSLLLRSDLPRAHRLAKEVYAAQPGQPLFAATHAYSLHVQGQTGEGVRVLEKLKPEWLEKPAVAAYYGILLAASGKTNEARKYLEIGRHAKLLPEEKALVDAALQGL